MDYKEISMSQDQCPEIVHSDLETTHTEGQYAVDIRIYRSADSGWFLEPYGPLTLDHECS